MFFSKKLSEFANLKHCFFSRKNGVSKGIYKSLNCGLGSGDSKKNILENLRIVSDYIRCDNELLITLNQMHGNKVIYFEKENSIKNKLSGDALITQIKNVGLAILTADCAPILFYDPDKKITGCIHSGWKGALKGVIKNTISKLARLNCSVKDLVVAVGPCIKKEDYEVDVEFYENFLSQNKKNKFFFQKKSNNKYVFDLREFINDELLSLNVKKIDHIEMNTFSDKENFFSYRRSCKNKEVDFGRCISVILMT